MILTLPFLILRTKTALGLKSRNRMSPSIASIERNKTFITTSIILNLYIAHALVNHVESDNLIFSLSNN
jgi:hypothetical protein